MNLHARQSLQRAPPNGLALADQGPDSQTLEQAKASMHTTTQTLEALLEVIECERVEWWNAPATRERRRKWLESGESDKATRLQVVNNRTTEMIREMMAKLGLFCRWSLGVEGS